MRRCTRLDVGTNIPWWLWLNVLGLDAPLLAISWESLLAQCFGVNLTAAGCALLGLACWLVYATDYMFDGLRAAPGTVLAPRHAFFRAHRKPMFVLIAAAAAGMLALAEVSLRPAQFQDGLAISLAVAGYLAAVHLTPVKWRNRWPREFTVAGLFTLGTFFWIWAQLHSGRTRLLAPAVIFSVICWMNCAGIEYWEWERRGPRTNQRPSASADWLARHMRAAIVAVTACVLVLTGLHRVPAEFATAVILSEIALFWVASHSAEPSANFLRIAFDVALYTPLLVFTVERFR